MSEEVTPDEGGKEFTPITSQEELDRVLIKRIERERSKFADYDDLKAKAAKFDEVEEANKSELQKAVEAAKAAEARASKAEHDALVTSVAADKGVPASALTGSTKEELEASADALIEWRGNQPTPPAPKASSLKSGTKPDDRAGLSKKEQAAAALRSMAGN